MGHALRPKLACQRATTAGSSTTQLESASIDG